MAGQVATALREEMKKIGYGVGTINAGQLSDALAPVAIEALWKPTEAMWGGLARDLVMWDRGMPNQYGSTLYKHLRMTGRPIPDWLMEEIPDIDHTPPKGTVAVCIFKAMLAVALGCELSMQTGD